MKSRTWLPVAIALLVSLFTFQVSLVLDDYFFLNRLSGKLPLDGPTQLYRFADGSPEMVDLFRARGTYPWWSSSSLRISFFRPLSSLLYWLDTQLFGSHYWLYHVHSVLWSLAVVLAAMAVFRQALGASLLFWPLLLFAVDDARAMPTAWLANRNALVALSFGLLSVWAWLRFRSSNQPRWIAAFIGFFAVGFSAGEVALSSLAYVVSYELFTPSPKRRFHFAIIGVLVVAAIAVYKLTGSGVQGSGAYLDPTREPVEYLTAIPTRALIHFAAFCFAFATDLSFLYPKIMPVALMLGVWGLGFWFAMYRWAPSVLDADERKNVRWLALGAVGSMLPTLATFPLDRLMMPAALGGCGVVGIWVHALARHATTKARWARRFLVLVHLALASGAWIATPGNLAQWDAHIRDGFSMVTRAMVSKRVVLLSTPDSGAGFYGGSILMHQGMAPRSWLSLSWAPVAHELKRIDAHSFELRAEGTAWLTRGFEVLLQTPRPGLPKGSHVRVDGADIDVIEADGGRPTAIRVTMTDLLETYLFATWTKTKFVPMELPEVGQTVRLEGPTSFTEMMSVLPPE